MTDKNLALQASSIKMSKLTVCSRCIYDERVDGIFFDMDGICNFCHQVDTLIAEYRTGTVEGESRLETILNQIKLKGKGKKYDCIIGVSGGTDSSYMLFLAKKWGLRPLAVHYDNTWNSAIATENIRKVLSTLDVDLYTHVVDNKESEDIFRAFFFAGVAEMEASTDLAFAEVLYRAAWKYNVKYVLEGHSFVTEGITPIGRNYFDGRYIKSVHSLFGRRRMQSYPLMTFGRFLFWTCFARIRKIRPFWYLDYSKEDAREFLQDRCDWVYYGGHHLENRMSSFLHSIYLPQKFSTDMRNNTLAALVRNGLLTREEGWEEYNTPPLVEEALLEYTKKRLDLTDEEYLRVMALPPRSWWEFPTYKKLFELLRPLFQLLAATDLVPKSFYIKYCLPKKNKK